MKESTLRMLLAALPPVVIALTWTIQTACSCKDACPQTRAFTGQIDFKVGKEGISLLHVEFGPLQLKKSYSVKVKEELA